MVRGIPLVHVAFGEWPGGRYRAARAAGIVAIGDTAVGVVSLGVAAVGVISAGVVAVGLHAAGVVVATLRG